MAWALAKPPSPGHADLIALPPPARGRLNDLPPRSRVLLSGRKSSSLRALDAPRRGRAFDEVRLTTACRDERASEYSAPVSLKKFEILEMIAKGGMAEVYRARTTGLQGFEKEVCVKKILPHLTEDESFVTMFINEAKLAATLSFTNIVQVHDLCVSAGGEYFIVMEYVDGKDLSDVIRVAQLAGREVPPEIAVHVVREVCQGLAYAHSRTDRSGAPLNIIHRDVSPHNVLVSFMGEVKIVDFGIAKASSIMSKTAVGILKGKYGYMSPEQARGKPLDPRSDIFNTGIVLYEMLVGERCFAGSSDFSTLNLMRNAEVTPPTQVNARVPKSLEAIVLKALSREREDRPQSALELERLLGDWARTHNAVATKSDLAAFMQELFRSGATEPLPPSTGVLEVHSVVAPPPKEETPLPARPAAPVPRPSTARAASLADRPVEAPPPEADPGRRDSRGEIAPAGAASPGAENAAESNGPSRAEKLPASPAAKPGARAQEPREQPLALAPRDPRPEGGKGAATAPPKRAPNTGDPREAPGPSEPRGGGLEAPPSPELVRQAPEPVRTPKRDPERKPASPAGASKPPEKKKGKQLSEKPKEPVGRRHLRPGLSQVARPPARRRTAFTLTMLVLLAGAAGAGVGTWRARAASREGAFRLMELASRRAPERDLGLMVFESEPPGLFVHLDGAPLEHPTPTAFELPRDEADHRVELLRDGELVHEGNIRFGEGPVALLRVGASPDSPSRQPGFLELVGAGRGSISLNERSLGRGPEALLELEPGRTHEIELRRGKRKRTFRVELESGERKTLIVDL